MKKVLSFLSTVVAIGVASLLGALLFAACQIGDSELVGKIGFVFVIFAPSAALLLTLLFQAKIGTAALAAPMCLLACVVTYACTGFLAVWATQSIAGKIANRGFWAIYWVATFAFIAIHVYQSRGLWRWTIAESQKSRSSH